MDRAGLDAQPTEKSFQSKNRAILAALYVNVIYFSSSLKKKIQKESGGGSGDLSSPVSNSYKHTKYPILLKPFSSV